MRILAALTLPLLLAGCGASGSEDADTFGDDIGAQVVCRQFVEDRLKAPSTADFSDEQADQVQGPTWRVTGAVDSENSFGAMIRNTYSCTVRFQGDDQWTLVQMTGLGN